MKDKKQTSFSMSSYYRTCSSFRIGEKSSSDIDIAHGVFVDKKAIAPK
jgi:hypothetical protein